MPVAKPFVIGLTGSIGMGKSETAKLFAAEGMPVFDADAAIHELYAGEAAAMIEAAFPGTTRNGAVDRAALVQRGGGDAAALARLEGLMHPLVAERRDAVSWPQPTRPSWCWIFRCCWKPALKVDAVVVATAPADVQRAAGAGRPGMTEDKFEALLARQMSDAEKRAQAHYVVITDKGLDHAREQVKMILADIRRQS